MSTQLVGFVGLGALGTHMARNLALHRATAGLSPLLIWNRTAAKSQKLAGDLGPNKVRVAETLEDLATECDVVITNLANDAVSKYVYGVFVKAVKASAPKSRIFVETSTIHPSFATELKTLITALPSTQFVASPVFGSPPVAEKAQLILLMSGEPEPVKVISAILCPAVGAKVLEMGEDIEKAPTLKLIGNSFILGSLEILAECQTLAEKTGLGAQGAQNLAKIFYTPPLCAYGDKMLNHAFDGSQGFSLNGGIKDATHVQSLAKTHGAPMPALEAARVHLEKAREIHEREIAVGKSGVGVLDVASLVTAVREEAGVAKVRFFGLLN